MRAVTVLIGVLGTFACYESDSIRGDAGEHPNDARDDVEDGGDEVPTTCGNGTCELGETAAGCPADCRGGCGDRSCAEREDQFGCPADCGAVSITAGVYGTCAVLADATVRCWGHRCPRPVAVASMAGAVGISDDELCTSGGCGSDYCALFQDGSVRFGEGYIGGCDFGAPELVPGLAAVVEVSVGYWHRCALLPDGTTACWGINRYGSLGDGTTTSSSVPVRVPGITGAVSVSSGGFRSCAVIADGSAWCWGSGELGVELAGTCGDPAPLACSTTPVRVPDLSGVTQVSTGDIHSCARLSDGTVFCWGDNQFGQLGDGTTTDSTAPVIVHGLTDAVAVSAGRGHTCALLSDRTVRCWGDNRRGELGNGTAAPGLVPAAVAELAGAVAVSAGYHHTCAQVFGGTVRCWGDNGGGQLGDGTMLGSTVPVPVVAW